jgi:hypothetical protein
VCVRYIDLERLKLGLKDETMIDFCKGNFDFCKGSFDFCKRRSSTIMGSMSTFTLVIA